MEIEWSIIDRWITGVWQGNCIPPSTWKGAQEFFTTRDLSVFSRESLRLLGALWKLDGCLIYEYNTGTEIPNIFYEELNKRKQ